MSVGTIRSLSDLGYTALYAPPVALVVIRENNFESLHLTFGIFTDPVLFTSLLSLTFVGAMLNHAVNLSIFGQGGPGQNPKNRNTIFFHKWALVFTPEPGGYCESIDEAFERVLGYIQSVTESKSAFVKFIIRTTVFLSAGTVYGMVSFLSILWLFELFVLGEGGLYSGVLLLVVTGLKLRGILFSRFPTAVPEPSAEWVNTPEFRKAHLLREKGEIELHDSTPSIPTGIMDQHEGEDGNQRSDPDIGEESYLVPLDEEKREYLVPLDDKEGS